MEYSKASYAPEDNLYQVSPVQGELRTKGPLNVGFQVTRSCNLKCVYCSEPPNLPDMNLQQIAYAFKNLKKAGVLKINLTGGEALLRKDLREIVDLSNNMGFHTAVDSNATLVTDEIADFLSGRLVYFETTIDGSPETHNKVRGKYNEVLRGATKIAAMDIPLYVAIMVLGKSIEDLKHALVVANELGASKVKFLSPIPKGRGKELPNEILNNDSLLELWGQLCEYVGKTDIKPQITLADWKKIGQGSVIIVNSDGSVVGGPSHSEENCVTHLGNILEESVADMWKRYPHKLNHIRKYTGETLYIS